MKTRFFAIVAALLLVGGLFVGGCASLKKAFDGVFKGDKDTIAQVQDVIAQTNAEIDALDAEISKLPLNDSQRAKLEKARLVKQKTLSIAEQVLRSGEQGAPTQELIDQLTEMPVIGGYVGIASVLGGLLWKVLRRKNQLGTALAQTVKGIEIAYPPDSKPEPLKTALLGAQDAKTKEIVNELRADPALVSTAK